MNIQFILKKRMSENFIRTRTAKILTFFFVVVMGLCLNCKYVSADDTDDKEVFHKLHAMSAVLMDADTMRVLGEKEGNVKRPMASTTKILTAIIALEKGNVEDIVTVSQNASRQPKVHMGMKKGEKYRLKDLLYSLLLESHNDSAVAIAEHIAGSVEGFAFMMNQKAGEIGCENAYFITPNGLDAKNVEGFHGITAVDLAKIMSYCVSVSEKKEEFTKISRTREYAFSEQENKRQVHCNNHNRLFDMMDGVIAGKTGFTGEAGYCYVAAVGHGTEKYVVSLLGCGWPNHRAYKWEDTARLIRYALRTYKTTEQPVGREQLELKVNGGVTEETGLFDEVRIPLKINADKGALKILKSDTEKVIKIIQTPKVIQAPIKSGTCVGKVFYKVGGTKIAEFPVTAGKTVRKRDYKWILLKISEIYLKCS